MFHLRTNLKRACMERIVRRANDKELATLDAFRTFDIHVWPGGFVAYNWAFHQYLAGLAKNVRMRDQLSDLVDQMERRVGQPEQRKKRQSGFIACGALRDHRCAAGAPPQAGAAPGRAPHRRRSRAREQCDFKSGGQGLILFERLREDARHKRTGRRAAGSYR